MQDLKTGSLLVVVAGIMNGSFALPMKRMTRWAWENIWLIWSLGALVVFPLLATFYTVPNLLAGYGEVAPSIILRVALFGAAWGVAQVLFGLSVAAIGMALTFSLVLGISAALGTVIPFVRIHADLLLTKTGAIIFSGIALLAAGMALCALAGQQRERMLGQNAGTANRGSFRSGLLLAIVSGVCACFMNLGVSFADPILDMAIRHGAAPYWRTNAVWLPLLLGGAVPNVLYSLYLMRKQHSAGKYAQPSTSLYWLLTLSMSVLWFGGTTLYGVASVYLGVLGPVLGWPVFMSIIVITASFFGWAAGEWHGTGSRPLRLQLAGIVMLICAVFLFSRAGS